MFSGVTESGVIASFVVTPHSPPPTPELISHIVDVPFFHGERRAAVVWDYRYQALEITPTTEWIGSTIPAQPVRHPSTVSSAAIECAICKADVPMGMMSCPRCRARFHFGFEGIAMWWLRTRCCPYCGRCTGQGWKGREGTRNKLWKPGPRRVLGPLATMPKCLALIRPVL